MKFDEILLCFDIMYIFKSIIFLLQFKLKLLQKLKDVRLRLNLFQIHI